MLGGRTGRDGIRGATFSSLTMDATTGEVAGASVQIGDPVTEKLLIDVLDGADGLWSAITDCGAGGLSSAVGEMAEGVGADVELDVVPLKYPGLAPWEVWLSEAQERMVLAVPPDRLAALAERCRRHGVELADLGAFTGDGRLVVRSGGAIVADLDTAFLHDGRPRRRMTAELPAPDRTPGRRAVEDPAGTILALLAHRNLASKADVIHRYDHEIGGGTAVRPLVGRHLDGPGDGVVIADPRDTHGLAIGIGVNPWYGLHDPEAMAHAVVDEAIRNVVAVGADPDRVALLDNFSWGDPRRPTTLGELVAAVQGCHDAAAGPRRPVRVRQGLAEQRVHRRRRPASRRAADARDHGRRPRARRRPLRHRRAGRRRQRRAAARRDPARVRRQPPRPRGRRRRSSAGAAPQPDPDAPARYRRLHGAMRAGLVQSCHDVSEGGLAPALAELCIAGRLGIDVVALPHDDLATALFAESTGRLIVEVRADDVDDFLEMAGPAHRLGVVTTEPVLALPGVAPIPVDDLVAAFHRTGVHR